MTRITPVVIPLMLKLFCITSAIVFDCTLLPIPSAANAPKKQMQQQEASTFFLFHVRYNTSGRSNIPPLHSSLDISSQVMPLHIRCHSNQSYDPHPEYSSRASQCHGGCDTSNITIAYHSGK